MHRARAAELLFGELSAQTVQAFESIKYASTYPKGALLFVEGQAPRGMFLLCSGRVKLSSSRSDGKRLIVKIAEPGDVLGLPSTVSGKPHEVSAESVEVCQVYFVKREDFLRFLKKYPDVCLRVAQQLSENYTAARWELASRAYSVSERLAQLLLESSSKTHKSVAQQPGTSLVLSQEEIAQAIGVARETVSRALSDLKKRGILRGKRSTWVICNESALKVIAGNY